MDETHTEFEQVIALVSNMSALDKVRLVEQIMAILQTDLTPSQKKPKRRLEGLWSGVNVSEEDIAEARREMWGNFPREDI